MFIIIPFIFAISLSILDGSLSSLVANIFILMLGFAYTFRVAKPYKREAKNLFAIVYVVYISMAYLCSLSFLDGQTFYVIDSSRYISDYLNNTNTSFNWDRLFDYYIYMGTVSSDVLYEESLKVLCGISNKYLGGATVYYMTLIQTLFGVLSAIVLYQIFVPIYCKKSFKYTLYFSLCSLFLIYSGLIIRDIIIAYFFIEAFRIVQSDFKARRIFEMLLLIVLAAGIRFLSGAFLFSFLLLYIYNSSNKSKSRWLLVPVMIIVGVLFLTSVASSVFFEDSLDSIGERAEHLEEREEMSGGLFNVFFRLPIGVRQIAILLFSQIAPFPPYGTISRAETLPQMIMGLDIIIIEFFWFIVSYTLIIACLFKKALRFFTSTETYLLLLSLLFLIILTAHPDIRRMMPVYPILYMLYLKLKNHYPLKWLKNTKVLLVVSYMVLILVYFSIKGI